MMPMDLILVRHGESEGNIAKRLAREGQNVFTDEFRDRHGGDYRLTNKGIMQAQVAGEWLRKTGIPSAARLATHVSNYTRAMETAAHLGLPNVRWRIESMLREREWGDIEMMSEAERDAQFAKAMRYYKTHPLRWIPPNGESILTMSEGRLRQILDRLHRQHSDDSVIMVVHGEVMWGFRYLLERLSEEQFKVLFHSESPGAKITNGQIIHYTRSGLVSGGVDQDRLTHVRTVDPLNPDQDWCQWRPIPSRPLYSNEELRELVRGRQRLLNL